MTVDYTDGVSLTELIRLVRMRIGDFPQLVKEADKVGDAVTVAYRLFSNVYEADGVTVTVDGTASSDYTVDYDSGWLTFNTAPEDGLAITFAYSVVLHTDEQIAEALNAAIDDTFGSLVVQGENDDLVADGSERLLAEISAGNDLSPEDIITKVEYFSDPQWVTFHDWRADNSVPGKKYLHWRRILNSGTQVRISYLVRPGSLDSGAQTLEGTAGLPGRAKEPIVLFACAKLVSQQMNARTHSNMFYNAEGANAAKQYDLRMRVMDLQAEGELALKRVRPRRVVAGI
jgi:hypothetical protein